MNAQLMAAVHAALAPSQLAQRDGPDRLLTAIERESEQHPPQLRHSWESGRLRGIVRILQMRVDSLQRQLDAANQQLLQRMADEREDGNVWLDDHEAAQANADRIRAAQLMAAEDDRDDRRLGLA